MESLERWRSLAQNPGIPDLFSFPSPAQGTKASSTLRPIRVLRLGNAEGPEARGWAFHSGVEGGTKC